MKEKFRNNGPLAPLTLAGLTAALWPMVVFAQTTQDIRIVTYNTQGDVSSPTPTGVLPYVATVLEGVGQEKYVGDNILQLPDIIALQETTSNSVTVAPLMTDLNNYYGSNIFNYSNYQATTSDGDTDGGGPNGLIYNQNTMNLIASVGVGTPESGTNGEFRQVVRYEFQPIADTGTTNGIFYVYDSHYKSGAASTKDDGSTDGALRNGEAQIIRNDEAANLPANAAVLYVGDYNLDGSSEAMYQTLTAVKSPSGVSQGQAFDPLNPTDNYTENWEENSTYQGIMTESDNELRYRDDLQTMTDNVFSDTPGNLDYISGSYHAFGNNGTTNEGGNIDSPSTNTAINDIVGNGPLSVSTVLGAMNDTLGSDHLPVVADYSLALSSQNLFWDNAGTTLINNGTTWDINHYLNWNNSSNSSTYTEGSTVTFNDTNNGHYAVTLNTTVNPGSVIVNNSAGNYTISGSGSIAGAGSLSKSGTGSLILSTANTFTGGTNVSAGLLEIEPTTSTTSALPAGALNISDSGEVQLAANDTLGSQSSNTPISAPTSNVNITSLSITGSGTFDITNNHIIINYGSGTDPISSIVSWIASGYAGGTWTGTGITSSTAAANAGAYGIGYADAADSGNPAGLTSGQIEIMYTLLGDANLDGKVNGADFTILAANFNQNGKSWDQGDFNYDGDANGADFTLLANNFNQTATQSAVTAADLTALNAFASANGISLTSVPEPASIGLLLLSSIGILARRRRLNAPIA